MGLDLDSSSSGKQQVTNPEEAALSLLTNHCPFVSCRMKGAG
jgi:hypothetical protein